MVEYICNRCGYNAKQKINLIRHLNRKNICSPLLEDISIENIKKHYGFEKCNHIAPFDTQTAPFSTQTALFENEKQHPNSTQIAPKQHPNSTQKKTIKCDFCEKTFTRKTGLTKHLKCCKIKQKKEKSENEKDEKDKKIKFLEKKQEELQDKVEDLLIELSKNGSTINNITNNTTNNQNKIINININNYGNENIDYLNKDYLNNLLQGAFTAIPKLIENIHFNPSHPENHNIKITNKKEPYIKVRKNDKWELQDKKETLETLVDDKYYILVDHYADVEKTDPIPEKTRTVMEQFHDSYMDKKELHKELQKKSEMIILNNS
tara:strand:- start:2526 stop:3485 length:960 start_codon:yes stop_codon:yes gene_type:complete